MSRKPLLGLFLASSLAAAGCAEDPVPTEHSPLVWGHKRSLSKDGVAIDGFACGERYHQAMADSPAALALLDRCEREDGVYVGAMTVTFLLTPVLLLILPRNAAWPVVGVGFGSFGIGVYASVRASNHLNAAVEDYNDEAPPASKPISLGPGGLTVRF